MDYSAFFPAILFNYLFTLGGTIVGIILCLYSDIYSVKEYIKSKKLIELLFVVLALIITLLVLNFSKNLFLDIPNIIEKQYSIATGTAIDNNVSGQEPETRGFAFQEDNGEIIDLTVTYYPIYKGDRLEVIYLPHSKFGAIVRKIED